MAIPSNQPLSARPVVWGALAARRRHLILGILGGIGSMLGLAAMPLIGQRAVDDVIVRGDSHLLPRYTVLLVVAGLAKSAFGALRKYQATKLMALTGMDLREALYRHLQTITFHSRDKLGTGELMARVSSDVQTLENVLSSGPFLAQSALLAIVGTAMLIVIEPTLTAAVLAAMAASSVVALRKARSLPAASAALQIEMGAYSQVAEQQIQGLGVIRGLGADEDQRRRAGDAASGVRGRGVELAASRAGFLGAFVAVPSLALLTVLGLGGAAAARGVMTPGELFAFMQYLGSLVAPVSLMAQTLSQWPQAGAAGRRIAEVLATEPEILDPQPKRSSASGPIQRRPGAITFDDVSVGYRADQPVLRNLTLHIPAGASLAVVGPSGAGKSTLALLIPRFLDPWAGRVLLDGTDVATLPLRDVRGATGMVFEDTVLFSSTIRENIALGRPDAETSEIVDAARVAGADDFIRAMPHGYDTVVSERGSNLSGGQRQRLAIARAVLMNPSVLLLDDATSAVDPETEHEIAEALRTVMSDRTTVIVAHRPATVALADRVVLLEDGRIVMDGEPGELLTHPRLRSSLALPVDGAA